MIGRSEILNASILIVDDREANVSLLEQILSEDGYTRITTTTNSLEVCALHRNNRYDLIVLDLQMPGMDGFQVMDGLKADESESYLPVIVLTAQSGHKLRALQAGAKDFISKPFDLVEVKTRIYNMLEVRLLYKKLETYSNVLEQRTLHDSTTGLPNRDLFDDRLTHAIALAKRHTWVLAVMFLDLDRFKYINDTHGHAVGDAVLKEVAKRLLRHARDEDTVCRNGGDEFLYYHAELADWTSSVSTPPRSAGCRKAMEAPIDPCLGRWSISRTPTPEPPEVPPIAAIASVMLVTPYPMWWSPSPRRARNLPTGVSGPSGSSSWT